MHADQMFPRKNQFMRPSDIPSSGIRATVTGCDHVVMGKTGKQDCVYFLTFKETELCVRLNITNKNSMVAITGSKETDDWKGAVIEVYATKVEFQGELLDAVRLRAPAGDAPKASVGGRGPATTSATPAPAASGPVALWIGNEAAERFRTKLDSMGSSEAAFKEWCEASRPDVFAVIRDAEMPRWPRVALVPMGDFVKHVERSSIPF